YLLRWTWIGGGALKHAHGHTALLHPRNRRIDLAQRTHAGREQDGRAGVEHAIEEQPVAGFARGNLPERLPDPLQQIDGRQRERRGDEQHTALAAVFGEATPLLLGELHPLPVVVAGRVLAAERDAKGLGGRAFRGGDVRLELHRVGARIRDRIDER